MIFNLKDSQIYKAVLFNRLFPAVLLKFYRILFFVLGFIPLISLPVRYYPEVFLNFNPGWWLNPGWSFIFLPLGFTILFFELFAGYYLRYPKIGSTNNIAEFFEFETADVFSKALDKSRKLGHTALSEKILLITLLEYKKMARLLTRLIPDYRLIKDQLIKSLPVNGHLSSGGIMSVPEISPEVLKIVEEGMALKDRHGGYRISVIDILASCYDYSPEFRQFLVERDLDKKDLEDLSDWYEHIWNFWRAYKKFWSLDNLLRQPPIGKDWIYGYSPHLTSFSSNLTDKMEFSRPVVRLFRRQKEIEQIEELLSRSGDNNVLLVGEDGVGKDEIVMDFADAIVRGKALPALNYKKVFDLNLALIAGASKEIADVQNILLSVLNEASRAGNIILVLRDFHNFIGEIGGMGRLDVSEILVPYLKSSNVQVIATTNPASYHKFIENRSELIQVFERINILEPDVSGTVKILQEAVPAIEGRSKILVTYGAIKEVVSGADKYIRTAPFPEKAFDLLSETVSYSLANKKSIITKREVNEVISRKTGVPLGPIAGEEKEKLIKLEEVMHKEIVGQDRAVEVVASTMRRLRAGLAKRGKPAGVFLFVGPTGVGKTLTAKILAKTYFGSADRMLRFDMSEYQDLQSLDRFLGSTRTGEPGHFVTAVKDNPFSLILLDEIEKADKNVLNIFLQVFDEGRLTDVFGRKINFEQNIIIATSNAGADNIREMVNEGLDPSMEKEKITDVLIKSGSFRPELLNRFDEVVIFHPLSQEQASVIAGILITGLVKRMKEQGYEFKPTQEITDYVAEKGFDPQFGARPMERIIKDKVEGIIAKKILDGTIQKGKEFSLKREEF